MILDAVVFINPGDFTKVLKGDDSALVIQEYTWHDGHKVNQINGIRYRQTERVPAVL